MQSRPESGFVRPADATFNNIQSKLIADPHTHNVYDIYAAGETGVLKGRTFTPNHIIVSRSRDNGRTWTANIAFTAPPGKSLAFIFPALAVDPVNGNLYAVWSDGHTVSVASSTDEGTSWTSPVAVSSAPATTAVLPWVAASNGVVDVVYYGTSAASRLDLNAKSHSDHPGKTRTSNVSSGRFDNDETADNDDTRKQWRGYAAATLAGIGSAAGLVIAWQIVPLLRTLLYEITALDPRLFTSAVLLLLLVAWLAALIPA